jgi:hypothetical protein
MTDDQVQKKLDQLKKIANELAEEAKRRYGNEGILFFEAEGTFHVMARDCDSVSLDRQEGIRFSSKGYCKMECGAW